MSRPQTQEAFSWDEGSRDEAEAEIAAKIRFVELSLRPFFAFGLEFVRDTSTVNDRLITAGRPDLVIYKPARMLDVKTPTDVIAIGPADQDDGSPPELDKGGNFFKQLSLSGDHGTRPINKEELTALGAGTYEPISTIARPIIKPAIKRALSVPELQEYTEDVILNMSEGNPHQQKRIYRDKVFVLYHLAAGMVCETDEGVKRDDDSIEERHLTI